jgi:hypothetical protein
MKMAAVLFMEPNISVCRWKGWAKIWNRLKDQPFQKQIDQCRAQKNENHGKILQETGFLLMPFVFFGWIEQAHAGFFWSQIPECRFQIQKLIAQKANPPTIHRICQMIP